jgi:cell division septal protein FtsQ
MFAQMKSRRKEEQPNCSPNSKVKVYPLIFPILIPLLFPFTFIGVMVYFIEPPSSNVRYIEVNGQDCHIEYVKDRRNSHGGGIGHDRAVCP